jgi:hypothetical protein
MIYPRQLATEHFWNFPRQAIVGNLKKSWEIESPEGKQFATGRGKLENPSKAFIHTRPYIRRACIIDWL